MGIPAMKRSSCVSKSVRKNRKAQHSTKRAPNMMSSHIDKNMRNTIFTRHSSNIRSLPVCTNDEVRVLRGRFRGCAGRVTAVNRRKRFIYIEHVVKDKNNGQCVKVGINP